MGKVLKPLLIVAAIAVNVIPGVGQAISGAIVTGLGGTFAALGVASVVAPLIGAAVTLAGLSAASSLVRNAPKVPAATLTRLSLSFDPLASRKLVFGHTAFATDVLYAEPNSDQAYVDYIIACAAHKVDGFETITIDNNVLWTAAGGVQGVYVGYATVDVRPEGNSSNTVPINGGGTWNTDCRLTGCAYVHLRIKRTGASSKQDSPFANGLPGNMRIVGRGMPLYDVRRDSTRGGSGSHRANDQSTWEFTSGGVEIGENTALQALAVKLGWRIGSEVSVGAGYPIARLDFADYIDAANISDEDCALPGGGTQKRYRTAGVFADSDAATVVLDSLCLHCQGEIRDVSGKLGIRLAHNDLGGTLPVFSADDVLGAFNWREFASVSDTPTEVGGRYTDPTSASNYQLAPYTSARATPADGIPRPDPVDFPLFQEPLRAQRVAQLRLRRRLVAGVFTADFGTRAWGVRASDPLQFGFSPAGIAAGTRFRVNRQTRKIVLDDGGAKAFCPLELGLDDPWVYEWDPTGATIPLAAVPAPAYNPRNAPDLVKTGSDIGVENGATVGATPAQIAAIAAALNAASSAQATADGKIDTFYQTTPPAGTEGDLWFDTDDGYRQYRYSGSSWSVVADTRIGTAITAAAGAQATADGKVTTFVGETAPSAQAVGDLWFKASTGELRRAAAAGSASWSAPLSDVTALQVPSLVGDTRFDLQADNAGNYTTTLPLDRRFVALQGVIDVSASAHFVLSDASPGVTGVTVDDTAGPTRGVVTIPAGVGAGTVVLTATMPNSGVATQTLNITKTNAQQPSGGGGGGGSATVGAPSASNSASYGTSTSATITLAVAAGQTITFAAPLTYTVGGPISGSVGCYGKWQYRLVGSGTWIDAAAEIAESYVAVTINEPPIQREPGGINVNMTAPGLAAGSYELRLIMRNATTTRVLTYSGAISATAA